MGKLNRFHKGFIGMLLVACLAFGGIYGCATSSESSAPPPSAGSEPPGTVSKGAISAQDEAIDKRDTDIIKK